MAHDHGQLRWRQGVNLPDDLGSCHGVRIGGLGALVKLGQRDTQAGGLFWNVDCGLFIGENIRPTILLCQ
jgi:hypothetical protein